MLLATFPVLYSGSTTDLITALFFGVSLPEVSSILKSSRMSSTDAVGGGKYVGRAVDVSVSPSSSHDIFHGKPIL